MVAPDDPGDMGLNFKGRIEDLKPQLLAAGLNGDWSESNGNHVLRLPDGAVLNWAPSKGTIWCQGPAHAKHELEVRAANALGGTTAPSSSGAVAGVDASDKATIFVVHGHDTDAREQLELALHRLGLQPFILMNSSGGGDTIIEALEKRIGKKYTSDFGIVLFTPDDMGYVKHSPDKVDARARQNVVLEAGMLMASLTRARVVFLVKGHVEMPSDLHGVIYAHFNSHVREALPKVIARMQEAGIALDAAKIAHATGA